MSGIKYVGMDVHQATTVVAVLNGHGKLVQRSVVETKAETLREGGEAEPPGRSDGAEARQAVKGREATAKPLALDGATSAGYSGRG
jgi:hypothetical protein